MAEVMKVGVSIHAVDGPLTGPPGYPVPAIMLRFNTEKHCHPVCVPFNEIATQGLESKCDEIADHVEGVFKLEGEEVDNLEVCNQTYRLLSLLKVE